jgi:IstB-like ATP binding protein
MTAAAPAASPAPPQVLLAHHRKLPTFLREYEKLAAEAAREGLDHVRFLLRLAELELIDRERRMVERRICAARFPAVKSFDTFDFAAIPSLKKPLVLELARCEYVVACDHHRPRQQWHRQDAGLAVGDAGELVAFFLAVRADHLDHLEKHSRALDNNPAWRRIRPDGKRAGRSLPDSSLVNRLTESLWPVLNINYFRTSGDRYEGIA